MFLVYLARIGGSPRLPRPTLLLYLTAVFLNAALLFMIEPMIARMILPLAGGSPAVWNTSLFFFQLWLLLGYLYAHVAASWLGTARHAAVHLALLSAGVIFLPVNVAADWFTAPGNPALAVFAALIFSVGVPFFVVSAGAPLLQKWFSEAEHPAARDPYFIYAASNLGSLFGLLAYPFVLERHFTLNHQGHLWLYGYLALGCATALCFLLSRRRLDDPQKADANPSDAWAAAKPTVVDEVPALRRFRWLCWSLVPSSLLLGVTSHMTTDVVSAPLLWIVPLLLYLVTFIVAFARDGWATHDLVVRWQAFLILGAALTVFLQATTPVTVIVPLHLLAFFATSLVCHGALAKDRPGPDRLTEFYLWVSLGGALGGFFNAFVAPLLFRGVLEYPLAMAAAAFLRPYVRGASRQRWDGVLDGFLPAVLFFAMLALVQLARAIQIPPLNRQLLVFAVPGVVCLVFAYRPVRFGLGLSAMLFASMVLHHPMGRTLYQGRSFFGLYRVFDDNNTDRHVLFHGTTAHGAQNLATPLEPISYYHRTGPAGQVLRAASRIRPDAQVAVVGLGTGALACHGGSEQKFTFFEIDPLVEQIARDGRLFTYLRDCPPRIEVVIGDARLSLAKAPQGAYDVLVLDAFSSDAIPTHLLTLEAMQLYLAKIAADGLILIHISNRHMDMAPIVARLARELKLVCYLRNDFQIAAEEHREGKSASRWILLARERQAVASFIDGSWRALSGQAQGPLWTDDFADVLSIVHW
jgi:spermidine synthase